MSSLTSPNTSNFDTSNNGTKCLYARKRLTFFSKIRKLLILLNFKTSRGKRPLPKFSGSATVQNDYRPSDETEIVGEGKREEVVMEMKESGDCGWVVLQKSVKKLHFGSWEEKEAAVAEIRRLAKQDSRRRKSMVELGVIPPLVAMFGSEVTERRTLAVQALVELANGSYTNKALMVEAGLLSKFPEKLDINVEESTRQEFVQLLFSISSLANSQLPVINTSRITPFVVNILESSTNNDTIELCLATLYNLSSVLENSGIMVKNGVVSILLRLIFLREMSETVLSILGNLVVTLMGKKALEDSIAVPASLFEIMTWEDKPKCQELAIYILMILAHQSTIQREKMAKAGIVPVLLEVSLLGSPLAQKRALKLLQWFKDERQMRVVPHSGPQMRRAATLGSPVRLGEVDEGKRLMKNIVKQSLYKNMETITRRANNGPGESSRLKALVISSSSKSLPY